MNDSCELGLMYEDVVRNTYVINISDEDTSCSEKDRIESILHKINKLIDNTKTFDDAGGLVALTTIKNYIQEQ